MSVSKYPEEIRPMDKQSAIDCYIAYEDMRTAMSSNITANAGGDQISLRNQILISEARLKDRFYEQTGFEVKDVLAAFEEHKLEASPEIRRWVDAKMKGRPM